MRWALIVAMLVGGTAIARANTLVIVVDRSMPAEKLTVVAVALDKALAGMQPEDEIAVIAAGPTASTAVALQSVTNAKAITGAIDRITWSKDASVSAGLRAATTLLARVKRGETHVLVVTDTAAVAGVEKLARDLRRQGIVVSALDYQGANGTLRDTIATNGGGTSYASATTNDLVDAFVAETGHEPVPKPFAVVFVIDRSGSMQGPRLEAAKESVRIGVEVLAPTDTVAVVAFDSESQVLVRPQLASNRMRIANQIARLQSGGGTNIYAGLKDAYDMLAQIPDVERKVIVLTDGESAFDGVSDLVKEMHDKRIEVSAVGLQGADRTLLSLIADAGGGRLYMVEDLGALPKIFMKETSHVVPSKRGR